ncbi:hypothetical protein OF83DRAFT_1169105 [Amylostereum chailletii]|nr:hypothetical protein OF83DRAFT_1169105 [Amylostereum chailletii]
MLARRSPTSSASLFSKVHLLFNTPLAQPISAQPIEVQLVDMSHRRYSSDSSIASDDSFEASSPKSSAEFGQDDAIMHESQEPVRFSAPSRTRARANSVLEMQ